MSGKERHRLELMGRIKRKEITLVKAADLMEIGYRQAKRIWKCFGDDGGGTDSQHSLLAAPCS